MSFTELLNTGRPVDDGTGYEIEVPELWSQGRTVFGGLQQAIVLQAMRQLVGPEAPLRSMQTLFIGPVTIGKVHATATVLRKGRSVIHAEGRIVVDGATACVCTAAFGLPRASEVVEKPQMPPPHKSVEDALQIPQSSKGPPTFLSHFHCRWGKGRFPTSGERAPSATIYTRFKHAEPLTEAHLLAIADIPPSPALSQFNEFKPASSMTATVELFPTNTTLQPDDWIRLDVDIVTAADGYVVHDTRLWSPAGELLGFAHQTVTVFG